VPGPPSYLRSSVFLSGLLSIFARYDNYRPIPLAAPSLFPSLRESLTGSPVLCADVSAVVDYEISHSEDVLTGNNNFFAKTVHAKGGIIFDRKLDPFDTFENIRRILQNHLILISNIKSSCLNLSYKQCMHNINDCKVTGSLGSYSKGIVSLK